MEKIQNNIIDFVQKRDERLQKTNIIQRQNEIMVPPSLTKHTKKEGAREMILDIERVRSFTLRYLNSLEGGLIA